MFKLIFSENFYVVGFKICGAKSAMMICPDVFSF